jgi:acyl carrier protein
MDTRPGILKTLHAVADTKADPAPDESLFDSGLLDSFTLNDLVMGLEKEFQVAIPDADISARRFDTVARIEQYLNTKVK